MSVFFGYMYISVHESRKSFKYEYLHIRAIYNVRVFIYRLYRFVMPPTSEKLRVHIGLGLSVRSSVCLSVILGSLETQEPLMLES